MKSDTALDIDTTIDLNHGGSHAPLRTGHIPKSGWAARRGTPWSGRWRWAIASSTRRPSTGTRGTWAQRSGESDIPREELFVTTKLHKDDHGYEPALRAFDESLDRLGLDHVDLYLIHWPESDQRLGSWEALERVLDEGRARAIGVSNYMVHHLEEVLEAGQVVPAVNQIELHPFNYGSRRDVVSCAGTGESPWKGTAPSRRPSKLDHPTVTEIAGQARRTPAQVLIRWALQHRIVTIPKSTNRDRIRENADVFDFELDADQMSRLDDLDEDFLTSWDPRQVE
jgi:diketogulonate reductase-like aldo/keto reductase